MVKVGREGKINAEEAVKKACSSLHGKYEYGRCRVKGVTSDLEIRSYGRGVLVENEKSDITFRLSPVRELILPEDGARFTTKQNQEIQLYSSGAIYADLHPGRLERRIAVLESKVKK